jgi:hypothetical protein
MPVYQNGGDSERTEDAMRKPSIPAVNVADQRVASLLRPMKQNIEAITGVFGEPLTELPSDASLEDVISKINAIITRLNA